MSGQVVFCPSSYERENTSEVCGRGDTLRLRQRYKTRSTKSVIIVGICNACHPFYTGQQKFVDTAGRVDKFQQRMAKTKAAQAEAATRKKKR